MMQENILTDLVENRGEQTLPGALTQKVKGMVEMAKGEVLKNRHIFKMERDGQKVFYYASTLRKRKK
jgi:hypothetical protein